MKEKTEKIKGKISVSQFLMCSSKSSLSDYGSNLTSLHGKNNKLLIDVSNKYLSMNSFDNLWVIEDIQSYCDKVLDDTSFMHSKLYSILNDLYDKSDCMIFWYGNEYDDLEVLYSKNEMINYVTRCVTKPACEIYAIVKKY